MEKIDFKKENIPFTMVANGVLNDPNLSFNAKGLYAYLYSKPEGWYFSTIRMEQDSTDGRRHIRKGLKELEDVGYLFRQKQADGRVLYKIIYPPIKPELQIGTMGQNPELRNATVPKRHSGESALISNKDGESNKDNTSNKESPSFEEFWKAYPKKELKKKTQEIWKRKKLDSHLVVILAFIEKAKLTDRWKKNFVRQPPAFLNNECWNDDLNSYNDSFKETIKVHNFNK